MLACSRSHSESLWSTFDQTMRKEEQKSLCALNSEQFQKSIKRYLSYWTESFFWTKSWNTSKKWKEKRMGFIQTHFFSIEIEICEISDFCCFQIWLGVFCPQTAAPLHHNFSEVGKREENFLIGFQLLNSKQVGVRTVSHLQQQKNYILF